MCYFSGNTFYRTVVVKHFRFFFSVCRAVDLFFTIRTNENGRFRRFFFRFRFSKFDSFFTVMQHTRSHITTEHCPWKIKTPRKTNGPNIILLLLLLYCRMCRIFWRHILPPNTCQQPSPYPYLIVELPTHRVVHVNATSPKCRRRAAVTAFRDNRYTNRFPPGRIVIKLGFFFCIRVVYFTNRVFPILWMIMFHEKNRVFFILQRIRTQMTIR